jgi:aminomethyltransferase
MSVPLVVERSRALLRVTGRDPVKMIHGLATADITAVSPNRGAYTAFLTPKGRMVADARVLPDPDDGTALLLDTAPDAAAALAAHIARYVPPLFARAEDFSAAWAVVGVYGPGSDTVVGIESPDRGGLQPAEPRGPDDGAADDPAGARDHPAGAVPPTDGPGSATDERVVPLAGAFAVRTRITGDPGWDVFVPADRREALVEALLEAGGRPGDPEVLEALRIAAGVPRWGRELTEDVIPIEAGLLERAISQTKGCYTGQEVIVRILHRGHVNRYLRRLDFVAAAPPPGTELFEEGGEKPRGKVTCSVENEAGAIGLGYVRREVEPPAELRVGSPDGDPVRVTALD